jgi:hypothetical protein
VETRGAEFGTLKRRERREQTGEGVRAGGLRYPRDSRGKALGRGGARGPAASPHSSAVTPGSDRPLPRRRRRSRRRWRTLRPRL